MKKLFPMWVLVVGLLVAINLQAAWHDTGPPGIKKEKLEQKLQIKDASIQNIQGLDMQPMCRDVSIKSNFILFDLIVIDPAVCVASASYIAINDVADLQKADFELPLLSISIPHDYGPGIYKKVKDQNTSLDKPPVNKLE